MKNKTIGKGIIVVIVVAAAFGLIRTIADEREPKCIESGCDSKQREGSSYCYFHEPYSSGSSSYGSSSYNDKSDEPTNSPYSNSTKKKSTTKESLYDSYDEGYDDVEMDEDYDYERYDSDSDYADGVDDAMDEFDEDL